MFIDKIKNNKRVLYIIAFLAFILFILVGLPAVACVIYIGVAIYLAWQNNEETIIGFLILAVFQNIILIIFSNYISSTYNTILSLTKDCILYLALIIGFCNYIKNNGIVDTINNNRVVVGVLILLFLIVLKNVLLTPASNMSILVSLRQMFIPLLCFLCGYFCKINENGKLIIIKTLIIISVGLTLFGIVEMLLPENCLWKFINLESYLQKKISGPTYYTNGVAPAFYTWDFGFLLRRLVSITAEPLATAHLIFLGLALLICYGPTYLKFKSRKTFYLCAIILFLGCILGFSKGTIIYLAILFIGILYNRYSKNITTKTFICIGSTICIICILITSFLYFSAETDTAITKHINGLLNGIRESGIMGNGIGIAGYANQAYTGAEVSNGESYIGVNLNQIGYLGVILLCVLWIRLLVSNIKYYIKITNIINIFPIILMLGMTVDMLLSESSVSIIGTGIYFIILGVISKNNNENETKLQV